MSDEGQTRLCAALGFLQLRQDAPEVAPLRRWLDSWAGLGPVVDGMRGLGDDLPSRITTPAGLAGGRSFVRAISSTSAKAGDAWAATTPWRAVQSAAGMALSPTREGASWRLRAELEIVWPKLQSMTAGARVASRQLRG